MIRSTITFLCGAGTVAVLWLAPNLWVQYITDRGEREAQVAQACVQQQVKGKWSVAACARARK